MDSDVIDKTTTVRDLRVQPLTKESFAPFGDLILPTEDGVPFGPADAQLDVTQGTPRLYIMRLHYRGLVLRQITRHRNVTQCLSALGGKSWLMAVAPPKDVNDPNAEPALEDIVGFLIPGTVAVKLHRGTWHAGPYFEDQDVDFINLELSNTNEVDHHTSMLAKRFGFGLRFVV